jgi:hypothetical protein
MRAALLLLVVCLALVPLAAADVPAPPADLVQLCYQNPSVIVCTWPPCVWFAGSWHCILPD